MFPLNNFRNHTNCIMGKMLRNRSLGNVLGTYIHICRSGAYIVNFKIVQQNVVFKMLNIISRIKK